MNDGFELVMRLSIAARSPDTDIGEDCVSSIGYGVLSIRQR